jgi:hypothetical protein
MCAVFYVSQLLNSAEFVTPPELAPMYSPTMSLVNIQIIPRLTIVMKKPDPGKAINTKLTEL